MIHQDLYIYIDNENDVRHEIKRKEPWIPVKNLGIHTVVTGCEDEVKSWLDVIDYSTLSPSLNTNALLTRITKIIEYPLPTTCFSEKQCRANELSLYPKSLPKCGVSSKFLLTLRYGPRAYFGLGFPSFYMQQGLYHS